MLDLSALSTTTRAKAVRRAPTGQGTSRAKRSRAPTRETKLPVEHIIVLMQENRSFDHYLGHLRGHGQDDVDVPDDTAANPGESGEVVTWFHAEEDCFDDPNHSWHGSHSAWNAGE